MSRPPTPAGAPPVPDLERPASSSSGPLAYFHPAAFLRNPLPEPWRTLFVLALLLFGFWMLYFHIGMSMEARGNLRNNLFFHSDIGRVINDMTRAHTTHWRTLVHPLFVLLTHPIGASLAALGGSPARAAVAFNSCIGGVSVAGTCLFFLACRLSLRRSLLGALLLGFSSSHLYFGSAPETFIFSCLSLILLAMGLAAPARGWRYFLPVGVFSFGVLVTNLAFVVITYAAAVPWSPWWKGARRVVLLGAGVVAASVLLAYAQKAIWPGSALFFQRQVVFESERRFTPDLSTFGKVLEREGALLRYVFVYDFFAPQTYLDKSPDQRAGLQIHARSLSYLPLPGKLATGLWLALGLGAVWRMATSRAARSPLLIGLVLCLLYNLFLHTLYGDDLFLYSCNSCFSLVAWVVVCVSAWKTPRFTNLIDWTLLVLVSAEVMSNVRFAQALALARFPDR